MLNKKERAIMNVIYEKCGGDGNCLITLAEIGLSLPKNKKMQIGEIESLVRSLELDDYFDVVFSERKGEPIICVNLHSKGLSYKREMVQFRRAVINRLLFGALSALATFLVGRILFFLFR